METQQAPSCGENMALMWADTRRAAGHPLTQNIKTVSQTGMWPLTVTLHRTPLIPHYSLYTYKCRWTLSSAYAAFPGDCPRLGDSGPDPSLQAASHDNDDHLDKQERETNNDDKQSYDDEQSHQWMQISRTNSQNSFKKDEGFVRPSRILEFLRQSISLWFCPCLLLHLQMKGFCKLCVNMCLFRWLGWVHF